MISLTAVADLCESLTGFGFENVQILVL